jgi:hypothetical protein
LDLILKADLLMASVAEGFVGAVAAAAQGNGGAASQAKLVSLRIADFEVTFNAQRAVVPYGHSGSHGFLLGKAEAKTDYHRVRRGTEQTGTQGHRGEESPEETQRTPRGNN